MWGLLRVAPPYRLRDPRGTVGRHDSPTFRDVPCVAGNALGVWIFNQSAKIPGRALPIGAEFFVPNKGRYPGEWLDMPEGTTPIRLERDPNHYWAMSGEVEAKTSYEPNFN